MEKSLRGLIIEIVVLCLFMAVIIPICVSASSEYNKKKNELRVGNDAYVTIKNLGEYKKISINTDKKTNTKVNLYMKINKFDNEYVIRLGEDEYELANLEYTEDEENRYYNLGIYDVKETRDIDFKISVKDKVYYTEAITYSFYTEGMV